MLTTHEALLTSPQTPVTWRTVVASSADLADGATVEDAAVATVAAAEIAVVVGAVVAAVATRMRRSGFLSPNLAVW